MEHIQTIHYPIDNLDEDFEKKRNDHKSTNQENELELETILPAEAFVTEESIVTRNSYDEEPINIDSAVNQLCQTCLLSFTTKTELNEHTLKHVNTKHLPSILKNK